MKIYVVIELGSGTYIQAFTTKQAAEESIERVNGWSGMFILEEEIT